MTNITAIKRQALAARVTGWQGDPLPSAQPSASDAIEAVKRVSWSLRDAQALIRALHSTLADNENGLQYELARTLDEVSDLILFDEAPTEDEMLRQGEEEMEHEAAIMRSWT